MKLLVLLAIASLAAAQEPPEFEAASVKVSTSGACIGKASLCAN